jgi:hypothetical protein
MHEWTNIASVVLLAAYVLLTALIARYTRRSAEASGVSARAAEDSAKAARDAANAARDSSRHGDRAYVAFAGFKILASPNVNQNPGIEIELRNVGRTPTVDGKSGAKMVLWAQELAARNFDEIELEDLVLAPQTSYSITLYRGNMITIHEQSSHVYVWGKVIYSDIFGQSHETHWCLDYSRKVGTYQLVANLNKMT